MLVFSKTSTSIDGEPQVLCNPRCTVPLWTSRKTKNDLAKECNDEVCKKTASFHQEVCEDRGHERCGADSESCRNKRRENELLALAAVSNQSD